jgi:hypothetical protein
MKGRRNALGWFLFILGATALPPAAAGQTSVLHNEYLRAEFSGCSLSALVDVPSGFRIRFANETFSLTLDGAKLTADGTFRGGVESAAPGTLTCGYGSSRFKIRVVYELRPGWRFMTKQIFIEPVSSSGFHVDEIQAFAATMTPAAREELPLSQGRFGTLLRYSGDGAASSGPLFGSFLLYQNPFNEIEDTGQAVVTSYPPDMDWKPDYGPFVSDRFCIGLHRLSGRPFPAEAIPEWKYVPDYPSYLASVSSIDMAEADALVECVRAFLLYRPEKSIRVHVPWCENDYQIDVATPNGWEEYQRIIDRAAELGCRYTLFTPANSGLSNLKENRDAWGWENVLFFALGQKIRKGEWNPARDPVPSSLQEMLAYGASKNIRLISYSYPSLPFLQNPEWTKWAGDKAGGRFGADTGIRSFQDWWIGNLVDFARVTGAGGYSFDHWWISYDNASSKYAQWFGCRRILETLRERIPGIVIDGRQQYMNFGPWTWLAGSYPHPTLTDEQPESFTAFPDLHTDRVSANRQRFAAWTYRMQRFCPPEIMPGFITHQSERSDAGNVMRRDRFRPRDWDVLGWKYSLLSSIATAPFNHVVNFIPARDSDEYKALSEEDKCWFREWLDWTDTNAAFLRRIKPIIGQPMIGRIDGTAACDGDRGFVFLFNPNYRQQETEFALDASIGLVRGSEFLLEEIHPEKGRLIGQPWMGIWKLGDRVRIQMGGTQALVLEIKPVTGDLPVALLFNARGRATLQGRSLALSGVEGEIGTVRRIAVRIPAGVKIARLTVNGTELPFQQHAQVVFAQVQFSGDLFRQCQPIWTYDPAFTGGTIRAAFKIPRRVRYQLLRRQDAWPVNYTNDDLLAPWLGSHRLLLFAQIFEPDESALPILTIDGQPVGIRKAYNSVYAHSPERTFLGFYADVSFLEPDTEHRLTFTVPALAAGRFQGLFFENVEPEYTGAILK